MEGKTHFPAGRYLIVVDTARRIYIYPEQTPLGLHYKHSSCISGKPCCFAGEVEINESSQIVYLNNKSGHYRPPVQYFAWMKLFLEARLQPAAYKNINFDFHSKMALRPRLLAPPAAHLMHHLSAPDFSTPLLFEQRKTI